MVSGDGARVGEGAHRGAGGPHAEVVALEAAGESARDGTLYVTLEPCDHHGRTPPCVDALLQAGVARVFVASVDPDPNVSGRGIARLRAGGVEVEVGLLGDLAEAIDPAYFHHRRTGRPLLTWKWAMTLDGATAADDGSSRWVSGEEARADAHLLRSTADAIIIGSGTLLADDPELSARVSPPGAHQPRPVIVAGERALPNRARIWARHPVVVATTEMELPSGELVLVDGEGSRPDPRKAVEALGALGLLDLLLEGGSTLAGAWWEAGLVDRGVMYLAGKIGGGQGVPPLSGRFDTIDLARRVEIVDVHRLGPDLRIGFTCSPG